MKRILSIFIVVVALIATSCKETPGLVYDVTATAEGQVEFTWFNGGARVDGNAVVTQCNDTSKVKVFGAVVENAIPLCAALGSDNAEVVEAAQTVNNLLIVNGVEGNYHLTLKGYVKYGNIVFAIDEEYPTPTEEPTVEEVSE